MATQQAEGMVVSKEPDMPADSEMASPTTTIGSTSCHSERYPPNAVLPKSQSSHGETDISTASTTSIHEQHDSGVPAALTESVSSGDIDELEDQLSSNNDIEPTTPAGVLASLSHGSSTQASAAMSSTPSSTMTSSSSSTTALSEPNTTTTTLKHHPQMDDFAGSSPSSSIVPSASAFMQKDNIVASQVPKRQRIPRACDSCRRKKIRCNLSTTNSNESEQGQACANCHQSGIHCTFTKSPAKRGPNKGYIQQLETRLAALESSVSSDGPAADPAVSTSDANQSRTARTHGLLPPTGHGNASHYPLPPQKKPRLSDGLPVHHLPQNQHQHLHQPHPLHIPPPTLPFNSRGPTNETWSRTTAPPTLHSSNAFFLSSAADAQAPRHPYPHHSPQVHPSSDSTNHQLSRSTLPPISRLLSTLPPPEKRNWPQNDLSYSDPRATSTSRYGPYQGHSEHQREERSTPKTRQEEDEQHHHPARKVPSRQASYSTSGVQYADYVPHKTTSPRMPHSEYPRDAALLQPQKHRGQYPTYDSSRPNYSTSDGSPASLQQSLSDYSPKQDSRLRWPASTTSAAPIGPSKHPNSLLSRLDRSAVLSLDSPAFRKAVFDTPAMRTFSILPPTLLEEGFQGCSHLIKAAHLLSTSSATLSHSVDAPDDSQWQSDSSAVIGESMVPMKFDASGSDMTCREIESLMMCYVDALRRGKLIAGILGAISGKLAILETRGLPCKRYQAVGILLAVWHTVGYSSRRMYFGTPSTSGPDALYNALDTKDPTILAICIFTYNLDKMCRRYCQNGETYVPPESIEYTRVIAASSPEPLPKAQLRLLSILDSFLLALNFAYNQSLTALPSIETLERQRHHLHSIVNDADSSDILNLLVGPHVLAMVACATLYCLATCREKGETETDADQKHNIRTLERDYLSILDALRNMTAALSATPDSSLVNSHPFADGGDMRLLYGKIANYVKINLAAAVSSSKEQMSASQVIGNLHSLGYLGTILAASQEPEYVKS